MTIADIIEDFTRRLPNKFDSKFGTIVKTIGLVNFTKDKIVEIKIKKSKDKYDRSDDDFLYSFINSDLLGTKFKKTLSNIKEDYTGSTYTFASLEGIGKYFYINERNVEGRYPYSDFFLSKDFNYKKISDFYYNLYGNKIFIEKQENSTSKYGSPKFNLISMSLDDKILSFASNEKAEKFASRPGTYLFYGEPGTGKSSFIFSESMKDKKVISMTANNFCSFAANQVSTLFKIFNPDILILEEFDKTALKLDSVLLLFERIRQENHTIILTANNIQSFNPAILRPKRIDKIIKFDVPKEDEIKILINAYSSKPEFNDKLFELLKSCKFSHAYIVDLAKKLNDDFSEVESYIQFLKDIFKKGEEDD